MNSLSTSTSGSLAVGAPRGAARIAIRRPLARYARPPQRAAARWALRPASWIRWSPASWPCSSLTLREILELDQQQGDRFVVGHPRAHVLLQGLPVAEQGQPVGRGHGQRSGEAVEPVEDVVRQRVGDRLVHPRGEARLLPADPLDEQLHHLRVELGAGSGDELGAGILRTTSSRGTGARRSWRRRPRGRRAPSRSGGCSAREARSGSRVHRSARGGRGRWRRRHGAPASDRPR